MAQWGNDVPCKRFPQNWSKYYKSKSQQIMQWPKERKNENTNNGQQNSTQKTNDWATWTPLKNGCERGCSGG